MRAAAQALIVIVLIALMGSCVYFGPEIKEFWGTRYANADRNIYENNVSHVRGTIEHIARLKLDYELAGSENHRTAIRAMVLTSTAGFDKSKLPDDLNRWVTSL